MKHLGNTTNVRYFCLRLFHKQNLQEFRNARPIIIQLLFLVRVLCSKSIFLRFIFFCIFQEKEQFRQHLRKKFESFVYLLNIMIT